MMDPLVDAAVHACAGARGRQRREVCQVFCCLGQRSGPGADTGREAAILATPGVHHVLLSPCETVAARGESVGDDFDLAGWHVEKWLVDVESDDRVEGLAVAVELLRHVDGAYRPRED